MPIETISEFILYVTPGFIALNLYRWWFPAKRRIQFEFIAWCVVIGVVNVIFIKWVDETYLNYFLRSDSSGFPSARFTFALLISGIIAGIILILQVYIRNFIGNKSKKLTKLIVYPDTVWQIINRNPENNWALVFLKNNVVYLGWIKHSSFFSDSQDFELFLSNVTKINYENNKFEKGYKVEGYGVYVKLSEINRIEFLPGE